ncbi:MAG: hypothetical protein O2964_10375 [Verrucomicrobia bacterium]|nr:hypothetical protein [Verrucomicrobiota bacterium]
MTLDDAQKQTVRQWIDDGMKVAEIQDKLAEDFDIRMTYMEVRFLVDDLGVIPKDPEPEEGPEEEPAPEDTVSTHSPQHDQQQDMGELVEDGAPAPGGKVSISIDQIARPGMLVSGKVTFSDGQSASWYLDQMGQLGLAPEVEGYKPSQQDLMEFQMALQSELSRKGF